MDEENIEQGEYSWGKIYSVYDSRGNESNIDIEYFNNFNCDK